MSEQLTKNEENLNQIREMINAKRLENGGGVLAESMRSAADAIGITHPALLYILNGTTRSLDVDTCLGVAKYLEQDPLTILRLAGHSDIADYLVSHMHVSDSQIEPYLADISNSTHELSPDEKRLVASNVRNLSRTLKESRAHYTAIIEEKPKRKRKSKP
jgi:plasmid maintenance system antidote protein VapI